MTKWEYRVVPMFHDPTPTEVEQLNRLGEEGWELVALTARNGTTAYAVFKRPLEEGMESGTPGLAGPQVMPW
jgi:hypothetical protein